MDSHIIIRLTGNLEAGQYIQKYRAQYVKGRALELAANSEVTFRIQVLSSLESATLEVQSGDAFIKRLLILGSDIIEGASQTDHCGVKSCPIGRMEIGDEILVTVSRNWLEVDAF